MSDVKHPTVLGADGRPVSTSGPTASASPAPDAAPPARRRRGWDIALSILFILLTVVAGFLGTIFAFLSLAFIDAPTTRGSIDAAITAQFTAVMLALVTVAAGLIATVVMLVRKRRAWWVALLMFLLVIGVFFLGWVFYGAALGG